VTDRIPDKIAAMVYVDSGPATAALGPDTEGADMPMVWEEIESGENLDGLSEEQRETFRQRAVPQPAGVLREAPQLTNDARLDVPTTAIATGYTSDQYKEAIDEGQTWLGGFAELRDVTWVDLPTSHWPMWSRPHELAQIIGGVARRAAAG
jgi:pimeloyl-ACP methyl ester carboxylesterase